jgi:hypothetical protein
MNAISHSRFEGPAAVANSPQPVERDWVRLTETLEAFSEAWNTSPFPPSIVDYLPDSEVALRSELIPELIKLDLELRWQQ